MKDSQLPSCVRCGFRKYIKESNERFSTDLDALGSQF